MGREKIKNRLSKLTDEQKAKIKAAAEKLKERLAEKIKEHPNTVEKIKEKIKAILESPKVLENIKKFVAVLKKRAGEARDAGKENAIDEEKELSEAGKLLVEIAKEHGITGEEIKDKIRARLSKLTDEQKAKIKAAAEKVRAKLQERIKEHPEIVEEAKEKFKAILESPKVLEKIKEYVAALKKKAGEAKDQAGKENAIDEEKEMSEAGKLLVEIAKEHGITGKEIKDKIRARLSKLTDEQKAKIKAAAEKVRAKLQE